MERSDHAACCLNYGEEHPQLLVTGGTKSSDSSLNDAWILDVISGKWREVSGMFKLGCDMFGYSLHYHTSTVIISSGGWLHFGLST